MSDWLVPYLSFNGNCEAAVRFYQSVLGGEVTIMHFGDAPPNPSFHVPDHIKNLVLHAELRKDGHLIRFSDTSPDTLYNPGNNISFALEFDNKTETQTIFEALAAGGKIDMPLQETFFSPLYGKCTDKFGVIWQVRCRE
ncbi:MAG TPA: VOC family protein [Bacillota bacterium]|nr:VOC family protein [Bacillota bacterium]